MERLAAGKQWKMEKFTCRVNNEGSFSYLDEKRKLCNDAEALSEDEY